MKIVNQLLFSNRNSGGNLYEKYISNIGKKQDIYYKSFILNENVTRNKIIKLFIMIKNLYKYSKNDYIKSDITIRNLGSIYRILKGKIDIIVFHHYDPSSYPFVISFYQRALFLNLKLNIKKIDKIVVVSRYWREFLIKNNIPEEKINIIYNPFEIDKYILKDKEKKIKEFKKKYNLDNKPIVYIGNPQKIKGADFVYNQLKNLNINMITTGTGNLKLPCKHLELSFDEYIILLHASTIVILMSRFNEGWNRVACEAMLCKSVVIGSGKGGMKELLQGGKQFVCENNSQLYDQVKMILDNKDMLDSVVEDGYKYASKFTMDRFINEWVKCIKNI